MPLEGLTANYLLFLARISLEDEQILGENEEEERLLKEEFDSIKRPVVIDAINKLYELCGAAYSQDQQDHTGDLLLFSHYIEIDYRGIPTKQLEEIITRTNRTKPDFLSELQARNIGAANLLVEVFAQIVSEMYE